jgi:hypothetical protein
MPQYLELRRQVQLRAEMPIVPFRRRLHEPMSQLEICHV